MSRPDSRATRRPASASAFEPASVGAEGDPRLLAEIDGGNLIGAIKVYRELTGVGLKEAKDAVEAIARPAGERG